MRKWDLGARSGAGQTRILSASLSPGGKNLVLTKGWFGITAGGVLSALASGLKKGGCFLESGLFQGSVEVLLLDISGAEKPVRLGRAPGEKVGPAQAFFTDEGRVLADWTPEGKMHFRRIPSVQISRTVDLGRKLDPVSFCFSPSGRRAAFFLEGGDILVLDVGAARWAGRIRTGWSKAFDVRMVFSLDERGIWAWKEDQEEAVLWRIRDGKKTSVIQGKDSIQDLLPSREGLLVLDRKGRVLLVHPGEKGKEKVLLPPGRFWLPKTWALAERGRKLFFSQGKDLVSLDLEKERIEERVSFPGRVLQVSRKMKWVLWEKGEKCIVARTGFDSSGALWRKDSYTLSFYPRAAFPAGPGFLALDEKGWVYRILPVPGKGILERKLGSLGRIPDFPEGMKALGRVSAYSGNTLFLSFSGDRKREDRVIAWRVGKEGVKRLWVKKTALL